MNENLNNLLHRRKIEIDLEGLLKFRGPQRPNGRKMWPIPLSNSPCLSPLFTLCQLCWEQGQDITEL